jgi:glycosyltransferase involved in cell wall biosynthesis
MSIPKLLFVREGPPFAVRMSKVLHEAVTSGFECHVLADLRMAAAHNIAREMNLDFAGRVVAHQWPINRHWPPALLTALAAGELPGGPVESKIRQLLASGRFDLVVVKDSLHLRRVLRSLRTLGMSHVPVMCDMYENLPELLFDTQIRFAPFWRRQGARLFSLVSRARRVERECLPQCDRVFVVVDEMKQHLIETYFLRPKNISVVANVEMLHFFDSISAASVAEQWPEIPTIIYFGTFGALRGLDVLIDAAQILASDDKLAFRIFLVGASREEKKTFDSTIRARNLANFISVRERVTHSQGIALMKKSSIGVIPHADTGLIRTTIPNKLFQYMAAAIPVVASDVGPLGRIVRECECGAAFVPGSGTDLARRLRALLKDLNQTAALGRAGRSWVERRYCWEKAAQPYRDYFEKMKTQ